MMPYFGTAPNPSDFVQKAVKYFGGKYSRTDRNKQVAAAAQAAYRRWRTIMHRSASEGQEVIAYADAQQGWIIVVMAGRPYHIDPEINHGIDQLIASFDMVVVSEDAVWQTCQGSRRCMCSTSGPTTPGMYGAAKYVTRQPDMRSSSSSYRSAAASMRSQPTRCAPFCEDGGKIYTQLKIDEISNLGAVKIRIRSLLAAVEEGRKLAEQQHIS